MSFLVEGSGRLSITEIDETRWSLIQPIADVSNRAAPKAVVVAVNSILGDSDQERSWSSMHTTASTTTWNCWIVTETSVGHIQVEYEHPLYDQSEEATREFTPSSWITWVRPLTDIIELRHGPFYAHPSNPTIFQPAEPITVIFNNGDKIKIPDGAIPVEHRGAADRIIGRLRAEVSF